MKLVIHGFLPLNQRRTGSSYSLSVSQARKIDPNVKPAAMDTCTLNGYASALSTAHAW